MVNPIPTAILAILSGIVLVEVFLFFGFRGLVGKSGVAVERLFLIQNYGVPPDLANWMCETSNFSIDYVLLITILILGIVSILAIYSTDGGEFKYHTKSNIIRFSCIL